MEQLTEEHQQRESERKAMTHSKKWSIRSATVLKASTDDEVKIQSMNRLTIKGGAISEAPLTERVESSEVALKPASKASSRSQVAEIKTVSMPIKNKSFVPPAKTYFGQFNERTSLPGHPLDDMIK